MLAKWLCTPLIAMNSTNTGLDSNVVMATEMTCEDELKMQLYYPASPRLTSIWSWTKTLRAFTKAYKYMSQTWDLNKLINTVLVLPPTSKSCEMSFLFKSYTWGWGIQLVTPNFLKTSLAIHPATTVRAKHINMEGFVLLFIKNGTILIFDYSLLDFYIYFEYSLSLIVLNVFLIVFRFFK